MTHHNQPSSLGNDASDATGRHDVLTLIREGMNVYDTRNERIGTVEQVYFGAASDAQQEMGTGPATISPSDGPQMRDDTIIDRLADVFNDADLPAEVREKLLLSGYIRLDSSGIFSRDRFITPDQIRGVADDKVHLAVTRDHLLKPE
jgi:hypothetical protein